MFLKFSGCVPHSRRHHFVSCRARHAQRQTPEVQRRGLQGLTTMPSRRCAIFPRAPPGRSFGHYVGDCSHHRFCKLNMTGLLTGHAALLVVMFATGLILTMTVFAEGCLDECVTIVFSRITAIIIAGLSVQYVIDGLAAVLSRRNG